MTKPRGTDMHVLDGRPIMDSFAEDFGNKLRETRIFQNVQSISVSF